MRLAHIHIPTRVYSLPTYNETLALQELLIQRHFAYKDSVRRASHSHPQSQSPSSSSSSPPHRQPPPTLLTFTPQPTYTIGRRFNPPLTTLPSPSATTTTPPPPPKISLTQQSFLTANSLATFHFSPRGGDLTFHGPGQLVAYPIIDLRRHRLSPRAHVRLLETTVMSTCAQLGVPNTETTQDPGVWIRGGERKICAVGVQVRRGITGHGIGLNVRDEVVGRGYGGQGMLSWGFGRIVACGLEGKGVTWLTREGARDVAGQGETMRDVAKTLAATLARELHGVEGVDDVDVKDITSAESGLENEA